MTRTEIEATVKGFLTTDFEISEDKIYPEARLKEDMDIDSLDLVDIIVFVDKNFGFKLKIEDMAGLNTLAQFCDYIESKQV